VDYEALDLFCLADTHFLAAQWPEGIHDWPLEDQGQHDVGDQARRRAQGQWLSLFSTLSELKILITYSLQTAKAKAKL
jgi:hypothetical protein